MGAIASISNENIHPIYISYPFKSKDKKYIHALCEILQEKNYPVIHSEISSLFHETQSSEIIPVMNQIMSNASYVFIVLCPETISSVNQAIEINSVLDQDKNIIYLMTDPEYTPENTPSLQSIVQHQLWFLVCCQDSLENTYTSITNTLQNTSI